MDGVVGSLDWEACDECEHWNGERCESIGLNFKIDYEAFEIVCQDFKEKNGN
ncbi:MAG: hypothetical protein PHD04_03935 [Candidatus Pacebacteria bacterium]|nr:hypothetical protein [Candidatus Paceibacterota bacterium]